MSSGIINFYDVLQCSENATYEELKSKYNQLVLQCHPDKLTNPTGSVSPSSSKEPSNNDLFIMLNTAWNTLKDPITRKLYDAELCQYRFQLNDNVFDDVQMGEVAEIFQGHDDDGLSKSVAKVKIYYCRCGGQYIIDNKIELPTDDDGDVQIECTTCSLVINIRR